MGNTVNEIYDRMVNRLTNPASTMPGSFTADNLLAVANEIGRIYSTGYDRLIARSHVRTAVGDDLDVAAKENHGMDRNSATNEEVNLTITGIPGTVINETMGAKFEEDIFMVTGTYAVGITGEVQVTAKCTQAGTGHMVPANAEWEFLDDYEGLEDVKNEAASSGGYDAETDEEFRQRIDERESEIVGYGNIAWFRATAREVTGVEKAKVFDIARGLGTVDIVIIAQGNTEATSILVKRVAEHIESKRIPGADVLVESGTALEIFVSASVYVSDGYSASSVKLEFTKKLQAYLEEMDFIDTAASARVSYAKILDLLINCQGVQDIGTLLLNGKPESVVLEKRSFPIAADPEIELEAEEYAEG